jgi:hypothetical protein
MSAFLALGVQVGLKSLSMIMSFPATSVLVLLSFYVSFMEGLDYF